MDDLFHSLPRGHYGAILADPPWHFDVWSLNPDDKKVRHMTRHYQTMDCSQINAMPVKELAAPSCVLFMWVIWPMLEHGLHAIGSWGFKYKTCAFAWIKADGTQVDMFSDDVPVQMGTGYWTRANSEVCLLATRGQPKRVDSGVRQAIIERRREHSRKPDCVHKRIEQLVAGPYLELFARAPRSGWDVWGNQTTKFAEAAE